MECENIKQKLRRLYGEKVLCRIGTGEPTFNISQVKGYTKADLALYLHKDFRKAIVWNLYNRRKHGRERHSLSISWSWKEIISDPRDMIPIYKKMGTDKEAPFEKVLVLDLDVLNEIDTELFLWIAINTEDNECPNDIKNEGDEEYDIPHDEIRKRVSTSRWERNRHFRNMVLTSYGCQCAICRCSEEKILEAAHIKAVSEDGTDDPKNGICLCSNHHIMYDKELIKIDFNKAVLTYVEESVKDMPWYPVFIEKYSGRILTPMKI